MIRFFASLVMCLSLLGGQAVAEPSFRKGFNLIDVLSFAKRDPAHPSGYREPPFETRATMPSKALLRHLRQVGFDFVRLPVEVGPYLVLSGEARVALDTSLQDVITLFHGQGFGVIVDLHPAIFVPGHAPKDILAGLDSESFAAYRRLTQEMATKLSRLRSGVVALELMNEPQRLCMETDKPDWQDYQKVLYADVRAISADLPVFLTGGCWSAVEGILKLAMTPYKNDERAFLSVHFYDPFLFTHQGAHWTMPLVRAIAGLPYPASEGNVEDTLNQTRVAFETVKGFTPEQRERARLEAEDKIRGYFRQRQGRVTINLPLKKLETWAAEQGIAPRRIVFTEIGVYRQSENGREKDAASRLRWKKDVTDLLAERGWGWAIWVLNRGRFGLFEGDEPLPDAATLEALGVSK
jgi:endoglucanase